MQTCNEESIESVRMGTIAGFELDQEMIVGVDSRKSTRALTIRTVARERR